MFSEPKGSAAGLRKLQLGMQDVVDQNDGISEEFVLLAADLQRNAETVETQKGTRCRSEKVV